MGERGNICVESAADGRVFLYTHWGGQVLETTAQLALLKRWRWNDPCYLRRIVLETMVNSEFGTETGFGIGTDEMDPNYPTVYINTDRQAVRAGPDGPWVPFTEFIEVGFG